MDETFRAPFDIDGSSGNERDCSSVELQVRDARLTDIDRITGLMERADGRWTPDQLNNAAEVLRQMVYLPNVSILVCLDGRMMLGAAVLAQRPSAFAGGLIGTVDLLVVEPGNELDGVDEALLRELMRQARNKGCVILEGSVPAEPADQARWEGLGFTEAGPRMSLPLVRSAVPSW